MKSCITSKKTPSNLKIDPKTKPNHRTSYKNGTKNSSRPTELPKRTPELKLRSKKTILITPLTVYLGTIRSNWKTTADNEAKQHKDIHLSIISNKNPSSESMIYMSTIMANHSK